MIQLAVAAYAAWTLERTKKTLKAAGATSEETAQTPIELNLDERWLKMIPIQSYLLVCARVAVDDIIAEGDKVWLHLTYTGTHTGEFFGLPPTGNKVTMKAAAIYRIAHGKLVEGWFINDGLDMFKQIGAIEYTEQGKQLFPQE